MAKIEAGILSNPRGKVAGVVGASWKGIGYVRAKVKPANPQTAAQQAQRGKMSVVVAAAQTLLAAVLIPFVSPFQKKMSGYNWFCKANIANVVDGALGAGIKICTGTEIAPSISTPSAGVDPMITGSYTPSASSALGENDTVLVSIYDKSANAFTTVEATLNESGKTFSASFSGVTLASGDTVLAFSAVEKTGLAAQRVSNSVGVTVA